MDNACRNRNCRNTACRNSACRNRNLYPKLTRVGAVVSYLKTIRRFIASPETTISGRCRRVGSGDAVWGESSGHRKLRNLIGSVAAVRSIAPVEFSARRATALSVCASLRELQKSARFIGHVATQTLLLGRFVGDNGSL